MLPATGKWQGALVAIKVVEHRLRKSLEEMDEARESLLSASVSHPNVVRFVRKRQHAIGLEAVLSCLPSHHLSTGLASMVAHVTLIPG